MPLHIRRMKKLKLIKETHSELTEDYIAITLMLYLWLNATKINVEKDTWEKQEGNQVNNELFRKEIKKKCCINKINTIEEGINTKK